MEHDTIFSLEIIFLVGGLLAEHLNIKASEN